MTESEAQWFRDFVERHSWRFARTMPHMPHWYVTREVVANDADFERAVILIREHGERRPFGSRKYTYLDVDGYSYWTMGAPVERTGQAANWLVSVAPSRTRGSRTHTS